MKKTFLYLVILAILGAGVWFFFFRQPESEAPLTKEGIHEDAFQVKDTSDIGMIFLASRDGSKLTLRRTERGDWWMDNRYPATRGLVKQLLGTLAQQQPVAPAAENLRDAVVRQMAGSAIKVELYNRKGQRFRTFYVGDEAVNYTGTYMLIENASRPYVVQVPLFRGYLTPRYQPGSPDWRDHRVMQASGSQISRVEVRYADSTQHSFTITQDASGAASVQSGISGKTPVDQNLRYYLASFDTLNVSKYVNGAGNLDSLLREMPRFATVSLTDKGGRKQEMDVYYYPLNRRSKNLTSAPGDRGINNDYDGDNFFGIFNGGKDTAIIQRQMFNKVLRKASDFYR